MAFEYRGPDNPPDGDGEVRNYLVEQNGVWVRINPTERHKYDTLAVKRETGRGVPRNNHFLRLEG